MIIKAKKLSLIRLFGAFLILIGLFTSIFLDFFVLNNWLLFLLLIIYYIPWLLLSFSLKLEINFIRENVPRALIILSINSIIIATIGILINPLSSFLFIINIFSNFSILICWHYSPSIYKKEKVFFVIGAIIYALLYFLVKFSILFNLFGFLTSLIPIILVLLGIALIFSMELIMKRKGLLNYV